MMAFSKSCGQDFSKPRAIIIGGTADIKHGIELLTQRGIAYDVIDGSSTASGFPFSRSNHVIDIADQAAVIDLTRQLGSTFILPVPVGRYVTTWAAVNEALGFRGVSLAGATNCVDKWRFHTTLQQAGLRPVGAALVPSGNLGLVSADVSLQHWPRIAKPRFGSGSKGLMFLSNQTMQDEALEAISQQTEDYIVEELASGTEFGVDAMVLDGEFQVVLLRQKALTEPPHRQAIGYYSVLDESHFPNLASQARDLLMKACIALGVDNSLIHADLIAEPEGVFLIELSARPSGHFMHNYFTILATGYDMLDQYISFQVGQPVAAVPQTVRPLALEFFPFENATIVDVPTQNEVLSVKGVVDFTCHLTSGFFRGAITQGSDIVHDGFVVVEGMDRAEIDFSAATVFDMFHVARGQL